MCLLRPIERIAYQGAAHSLRMDANLMRAPSIQRKLDQRGLRPSSECAVERPGLLAVACDMPFDRLQCNPCNGQIDLTFCLWQVPVENGEIALLHGLTDEPIVRVAIEGQEDKPAGIAI